MAYVAIKMRLSHLKGPADKPHKTPSSGRACSPSLGCGHRAGRVASARIRGIDIFPGATVDGWITPMQVPRTLKTIILSWGKDLFGGGETWSHWTETRRTPDPPAIEALLHLPVRSLEEREERNTVRQVGKIDDGKASFELSVIQVERNASAMVKKANMFNPDPHPGMEYLAIKMRLKYLSGPQISRTRPRAAV